DKIKEQLIAEFLGLDSFKLKNYNVSENKVYAKLYRDFKSNVSLPDTYLNEMAESKYFKHFYDNEVIKEVCDKWRNKA
ncbi:MAG: putative capsular polysaccharide synthesis family protein, partial [Marinoscillum sp.]